MMSIRDYFLCLYPLRFSIEILQGPLSLQKKEIGQKNVYLCAGKNIFSLFFIYNSKYFSSDRFFHEALNWLLSRVLNLKRFFIGFKMYDFACRLPFSAAI